MVLRLLSNVDSQGLDLVCRALAASRSDTVQSHMMALQPCRMKIQALQTAISRQHEMIRQASTAQMHFDIERATGAISEARKMIDAHRTDMTRSRALRQIADIANEQGFECDQAHDMIFFSQTDYIQELCRALRGRYAIAEAAIRSAFQPLVQFRQTSSLEAQASVFARFLAAVVDMSGPEDGSSESEDDD